MTIVTEPIELVRYFLRSMQERNFEAAQACLHAEFTMTFPGNARFKNLQELVEWAKPRYRKIGKNIERCEQVTDDGRPTVWCFGTLYGLWPDGTAFDSIRFVDRFCLHDGLLHTQMVWNDLAEVVASDAK